MNATFFSLLNLKVLENSRFSLIAEQGPFELRYYQRMICARVSVTGTYEEAVKHGMKYIFDYLRGHNFKVLPIKNQGHFFHVQKVNSWDVGLILPADLETSVIPQPINRLIRIEELLPGKVASLRFKGPVSDEIMERRGEDLKKWLSFKGLSAIGPLRLVQCDFLLPISFMKTNEVQLDVGLL